MAEAEAAITIALVKMRFFHQFSEELKHISVEVFLRELHKHILQKPHFPNDVV